MAGGEKWPPDKFEILGISLLWAELWPLKSYKWPLGPQIMYLEMGVFKVVTTLNEVIRAGSNATELVSLWNQNLMWVQVHCLSKLKNQFQGQRDKWEQSFITEISLLQGSDQNRLPQQLLCLGVNLCPVIFPLVGWKSFTWERVWLRNWFLSLPRVSSCTSPLHSSPVVLPLTA